MGRILIVLPDSPLPFGNAAARWYYVLLRGLVERGHDVTAVASSVDPEQQAQARVLFPSPDFDLRLHASALSRSPWTKFKTLRRPYSYPYGADRRRDLGRELARGFDVLH